MNEKLNALHILKLRWNYYRYKDAENIQNVAVTQTAAGLLIFSIQVFLFYSYDRNEKVEGHAMMVFCLAFFASMAGIFGCLHNGRQQCIRILYLSTCVLVMAASGVILFTTFCWDFFEAIHRAQDDDVELPNSSTLPISDELYFWLKCALFLSIITASLFTLTGICLIVSFQKKHRTQGEYYPTSELDKELLPM